VKVYCPRCEECYLPKYKNMSLDGFFFGSALPHTFMATYPYAIILPPKVYYYQPKIFGFKIFAKRGSSYFKPAVGSIRYTEDEQNVQGLISEFKKLY
jgi:hypothetical protein